MKDTENARKIPSQARSRATLDIILEAAAQLLESVGESGFNTNALAERAGVSIGTLYRYFPDKQSIIAALARQEKAAFEKAVETVLAGETGGLARDRAIIRAFLHAFSDRTEARRLAVTALYANNDPRDLLEGYEAVQGAFGLKGPHRPAQEPGECRERVQSRTQGVVMGLAGPAGRGQEIAGVGRGGAAGVGHAKGDGFAAEVGQALQQAKEVLFRAAVNEKIFIATHDLHGACSREPEGLAHSQRPAHI